MVSAARSASSLTWVSPAASAVASGLCCGSPGSRHFLHGESGPVLVVIKNGSKAFAGGTKSWGWTGEGVCPV